MTEHVVKWKREPGHVFVFDDHRGTGLEIHATLSAAGLEVRAVLWTQRPHNGEMEWEPEPIALQSNVMETVGARLVELGKLLRGGLF